MAGLDAGELGLDARHESALAELEAVDAAVAAVRRDELEANQRRAALSARVEALELGLEREDASAALLGADDRPGLLGSVASLVRVRPTYETAIAAALGSAADAVAVRDRNAALDAFAHLKAEDLGRAHFLVGGSRDVADRSGWPRLPDGMAYALDVAEAPPELAAAVARALHRVAVVPDLAAAQELLERWPDLVAVTRDGDVLGTYEAAGGSSTQPSRIEIQAALDDARAGLVEAGHACERLRFAASELAERRRAATREVEVALAQLHESDATLAALAEELGQLSSAARSAGAEADRLRQGIAQAEAARDRDLAGLAELEGRLAGAQATASDVDPDPSARDRLAAEARAARASEMEARLALRTVEERARGLAGRADSLRRAAAHERQVRAQAQARRDRRD